MLSPNPVSKFLNNSTYFFFHAYGTCMSVYSDIELKCRPVPFLLMLCSASQFDQFRVMGLILPYFANAICDMRYAIYAGYLGYLGLG